MTPRILLLVGLLSLAIALTAPAVGAATSAGPHLAAVELRMTKGAEKLEDSDPPVMSLTTFDPAGKSRMRLVAGKLEGKLPVPSPFSGPSWSADGSLIAFGGSAGRKGRIYVVGADGSGLRAVPGTKGGADPVLSPDGQTIAFSRSRFKFHLDIHHPEKTSFYASTTTWLVGLQGGKPLRLTRWRDGLENSPSSFSPDGSVLALVKNDGNLDGPRVMLMRIDGGGTVELVRLAEEPVFSLDGSRVAFISYQDEDVVEAEENHDYVVSELYVMSADGTGVRRLTRTKGIQESSPSWDPSGQRIAYVQDRGSTGFVPELDQLFPVGNSVMQINSDGSCRKRLLSLDQIAFYGVSWQAGAGHEAGRIPC